MAYAQTVFYPFVHDDVVFILHNARINDLGGLGEIFSQKSVAPPDLPIANSYYRPLLEIIYRLEYLVFGPHPFGYHLLNILLHLGNGILVYVLLRRIGLKQGLCPVIAGLFLLHPVQTETVACVAGISNLVFAFFCLWSLLLYTDLRQHESQRRDPDKPGGKVALKNFMLGFFCLLFYVLGLFSKEQAVILPLLVILFELCKLFGQDRASSSRKILVLGYFILTGAYFIWRKIVLGNNALVPLGDCPLELWLRVKAIPATLVTDFKIFLFPADLHYYRSTDVLLPHPVETLVFVLVVLGMVLLLRRYRAPKYGKAFPLALFALGWIFFTRLPTLNILPLIHEYSFIANFEHFLYLPVLGYLLLGGIIFDVAFSARAKRVGVACVAVLMFCYTGLTVMQNTCWSGEIPLFERAARFEPRLGRVRMLLARAYLSAGHYDRAVSEDKIALRIMQGYWRKVRHPGAKSFYQKFMRDLSLDLAHGYEAKGDFRQALSTYAVILQTNTLDSEVYNNMGVVYLRTGELRNAEDHFRQAVRYSNGNAMAKNNLGICLAERGREAEAEKLYREILGVQPDFVPARQNLNVLLLKKSKENP